MRPRTAVFVDPDCPVQSALHPAIRDVPRPRRARAALAATLACIGLLAGCQTPGGGPAGNVGGGLFTGDKDEEVWAIRCVGLSGQDQFRRAQNLADALKKVRGLRPDLVQVLTDDDGTAVYYGRYRRIYASGDKPERFEPDGVKDLELIRKLQLQGSDMWPFMLASMAILPTYRSPHPEWDLNNADGYWSLHVAVFYNTETMTGRRSSAEEYCRILRAQGEEAYFHHGGANSSVYIGAFPKSAVQEVREEDAIAGRVSTVNRIVDPRLQELMKRFPNSLHNGHEMYEIVRNPRTGEIEERIPTPSFPVIMPKAQQLEQSRQRAP